MTFTWKFALCGVDVAQSLVFCVVFLMTN